MVIDNNSQARRAMTIAFKLANKSINFSRPRRLQCLATAKKLIAAAEDFISVQEARYKDTLEDARKYNRTKDTGKMIVDCSGCGEPIPMNGETCVEFGVYACQTCKRGKKLIKATENFTAAKELDYKTTPPIKRGKRREDDTPHP